MSAAALTIIMAATGARAIKGFAIAAAVLLSVSAYARTVSEADLVGVWKGSYFAGQGETALILSVFEEKGSYMAIFDFYNLPNKSNSKEGKYYMRVSYNQSREKFYLEALEWIERPSGYNYVDLSGTITGDVFSGYLKDTNYEFRVVKTKEN
jgi:hypothetical protein